MDDPKSIYLDLLKRCVTNLIYQDHAVLGGQAKPFVLQERAEGRDWPAVAHTMIGIKRLDALHYCVGDVLDRGVPGDFIEAGVWRGGAAIFMRGVLKVRGITDRVVWAADSFEGVPPPNPQKYPQDANYKFHEYAELAVSLEEVQSNFRRYALLDEQVRFLKGWFRDSLPGAPIGRLAVLRIDGDLYESTMDALTWLYPRLEPGGYAIIDDFGDVRGCQQAVLDYRAANRITEDIITVDWSGAFWRKERRGAG